MKPFDSVLKDVFRNVTTLPYIVQNPLHTLRVIDELTGGGK